MTGEVALAAYLPVAFLLVVTPGATTAVVVRHTLDAGHRGGLAAAAGAALGNSTHAAAAAGGLALLLQQAPSVLGAMQVAGAAFLGWLGLRSLLQARRASGWTVAAPADPRRRSGVADGFVVNLLNPSILTFYLVIVPGFIRPPGGVRAFALLAAIHVGLAFACHLVWALAFDRLRGWLARPRARQTLDAAAGLALIALAAAMLWRA